MGLVPASLPHTLGYACTLYAPTSPLPIHGPQTKFFSSQDSGSWGALLNSFLTKAMHEPTNRPLSGARPDARGGKRPQVASALAESAMCHSFHIRGLRMGRWIRRRGSSGVPQSRTRKKPDQKGYVCACIYIYAAGSIIGPRLALCWVNNWAIVFLFSLFIFFFL